MDLPRFQLIDEVTSLDGGLEQLTARATFLAGERLYEGHFPGYPLVPGTVQTELMAQAAGLLCIARANRQRMPFLVGVEKARFRRMLRPGSEVVARAACEYDNGVLAVLRCSLSTEGEPVSDAVIRLSLAPFPTPALATYVDDLVERTGLKILLLVNA